MNHNLGVFDLLDKWRHFPNYQLERRADIFFALYLRDILESKNIRNIVSIIPEFPVRIGEVSKHKELNKSYKIDYVVIYEKNKIALIELKTDQNSRRAEQDAYLHASKDVGFSVLLNGLLKIYSATSAKRKYQNLLDELVVSNVLSKNENLEYSVVKQSYEEEIIYIQPVQNNSNESVITFHDIAHILKEKDQLAQRFSKSLIQWAETPPGQNKK